MPLYIVDATLHIVASDIEADDEEGVEDAFLAEFEGWPGELDDIEIEAKEQ